MLPGVTSIFLDDDSHIFEKLRKFCALYIRTWMEHPFIPMFVLHEIHTNKGEGIASVLRQLSGKPIKAIISTIEQAVRDKDIRPISAPQLMLNIMSLCVFPFVGRPIFKKVVGITDRQFDAMLEARTTEVAEFIIEAIKYRK
jgi:hypothetical protein